MDPIEFLRAKGILTGDNTTWWVKFDDGREFDLGQLLQEYGTHRFYEGLEFMRKEAGRIIDNYNATLPDESKEGRLQDGGIGKIL